MNMDAIANVGAGVPDKRAGQNTSERHQAGCVETVAKLTQKVLLGHSRTCSECATRGNLSLHSILALSNRSKQQPRTARAEPLSVFPRNRLDTFALAPLGCLTRSAVSRRALDPGDNLEAETFGAGDVETIRGHEYHFVFFQSERLFHECIAIGMRLELARAVDADGGVERNYQARNSSPHAVSMAVLLFDRIAKLPSRRGAATASSASLASAEGSDRHL